MKITYPCAKFHNDPFHTCVCIYIYTHTQVFIFGIIASIASYLFEIQFDSLALSLPHTHTPNAAATHLALP